MGDEINKVLQQIKGEEPTTATGSTQTSNVALDRSQKKNKTESFDFSNYQPDRLDEFLVQCKEETFDFGRPTYIDKEIHQAFKTLKEVKGIGMGQILSYLAKGFLETYKPELIKLSNRNKYLS